jgi:hypothetical protein
VRSTLPLPEDKPADGVAPVANLTPSAISGLTDPYGDVLNLSTGAFLQIRCDIAVSLTSVAAIDVSWTPWTGNDAFGNRRPEALEPEPRREVSG